MKKARMNISHSRFILKLKIFGEIVTTLCFYQNSPKIKLFLQNNAKFSSAGDSASRPQKQPPILPLQITSYTPAYDRLLQPNIF